MKKIICAILVFSTLLLCSCSSKIKPEDSRTVLTVEGSDICYDYFKYVFLNTKYDMDGGDSSYFKNNPEKLIDLKNAVLDTIVNNRAIELLAKKYGVKLTDKEKKSIDEYIKELKKADENYKQSMKDAYMTDYTLWYVTSFSKLWNKAYNYITSDESGIIKSDDKTVTEDVPINSRRIRYILIQFTSDDKEQKREEANEALQHVLAGEDFVSLVKTYCDDANMVSVREEGYYYTRTQILEEIENEVEKLDIGEKSGIIELSFGYIIIERLDIDYDYVEENFSDFITQYKARVFGEMLEEIKKDIKISYTDLWNNANTENVK